MTSNRATRSVTRIIALEEAFWYSGLRDTYPARWLGLLDLLEGRLDVGPERIRRMDEAGIDLQVLSHVAPGVQNLDADRAVGLSVEVNDWLCDAIKRHPTRLAGFATLPTQAPDRAADELERAVTRLGFCGALINGHTQERYLDDESFGVIFERAQALDVPIYIHPTDPPRAVIDTYYRDYPILAQAWGWAVETGTHVLRLMCGGVFDRYPRVKVIIGHMGELLPFHLERIDLALRLGAKLLGNQATAELFGTAAAGASRPGKPMQRSVVDYMRDNVFITTSGVFQHSALLCSLTAVGADNLLFSVDDPFADNLEAVAFLNTAPLSRQDKEKLAHRNAERLLRLPVELPVVNVGR